MKLVVSFTKIKKLFYYSYLPILQNIHHHNIMKRHKSTSRISFTAHLTGYTWYANGLSNKVFATFPGAWFYYHLKPFMWSVRKIFDISDLESSLMQRHLIIDHLLEESISKHGVKQVLELACGLSPRGYRFMKENQNKDILYIETDLPGIVNLKRSKLKRIGHNNEKHIILDCDIFSSHGDLCMENIVNKYLKPGIPTAIITEGLIYYFSTDKMKKIWKRILNVLQSFPKSIYLCDNIPKIVNHPNYYLLKTWGIFLTLAVRGGFYLHFKSDKEAEEAFKNLGFNEVNIHHPESYINCLPISTSKKPSMITVIEARI